VIDGILKDMKLWSAILSQSVGGAIALTSLSAIAALPVAVAQSDVDAGQAPATSLCPPPALSRIQSHTVTPDDTLTTLAAEYGLLPITLLAMNPVLQTTALAPGMTLRIPPFNGIEVQVDAGQTWQDLADMYRLRADVLFEVNGCPATVPDRIFVPGVSGFASGAPTPTPENSARPDPLTDYPLSTPGVITANYGWQSLPNQDELVFSSGITLETTAAATVQAVGRGTVAYIGPPEALGTLIVINHAQGLQTRYVRVVSPRVSVGDTVRAGQAIAAPGVDEQGAATLYFEVRLNSPLGWVARDPGDYIPELAVR